MTEGELQQRAEAMRVDIAAMTELAAAEGDHLLAAKLSEVNDHLERRYCSSSGDSA
jgi:hypothetical protein